jgi:hypothetical protein
MIKRSTMSSETTSSQRSVGDSAASREEQRQRVTELIRQALASLRFGQVVVTVQDGVVVQIDRTEKTRLR